MGNERGGRVIATVPAPPAVRLGGTGKAVTLPADLAERIVAERMAPTGRAGDFGRNLAVVRIEITDPRTGATGVELVSAWNLEKQHAEPLVLDRIAKRRRELAGRKVTVTHLYTERIPCSGARADCQWALRQAGIPRSRVYYSIEVPDGTLARKLASHYGRYRPVPPRPPAGGAEDGGTPPRAPRGRPKGPPRAGRAAATVLAATVGGGQPQADAAPKAERPAVAERATARAQRLADRPEPGGGAAGRGAAGRGVPPREPRALVPPPEANPAPAASGTRPAALQGKHRSGRVLLEYDFSGGARRSSVQIRSVDLRDFFRMESRITRTIASPRLRRFAAAAAPTAANLLTDWGLKRIKRYFAGFIDQARRNFDSAFPAAADLAGDVDLDGWKASYDGIVSELGSPVPLASLELSPRDIVGKYLFPLFKYERVNLDLQDDLARDVFTELPDVVADIGWRAHVLARTANEFEQAFAWIHTHGLGSFLPSTTRPSTCGSSGTSSRSSPTG